MSSQSVSPPDYAGSAPQILIAPLPDSATFFQNNSIQGEIYVKGLNQDEFDGGVRDL